MTECIANKQVVFIFSHANTNLAHVRHDYLSAVLIYQSTATFTILNNLEECWTAGWCNFFSYFSFQLLTYIFFGYLLTSVTCLFQFPVATKELEPLAMLCITEDDAMGRIKDYFICIDQRYCNDKRLFDLQ
jgi:hypothetical protein